MAVKYLTDPFVRNLSCLGARKIQPDKSGRVEVCDLKVTGLCLRVSAHGHKSWSFTYKMSEKGRDGRWRAGKQQRITLGSFPQVKLADARERAMELRDQVDAGVDPNGKQSTYRSVADTCKDYVDLYLKGRVKCWKLTEAVFRNHVLRELGDKPLDTVTRGDAHRLLDEVKQDVGVGAAREVHKALCAMYNWAIDREYVKVNPLYRLRRPDLASPKNVRTPLTDEQIRELWNLPLPKVIDQLRLILLTGTRKCEWGHATWADIDADKAQLTIAATRQKAGRDVIVPLSTAAMATLSGIQRGEPDEPVFGYYLSWSRLLPANGRLSFNLRPHDLRATCFTRMQQLGVPLNIAHLCLGHQVHGLTAVYGVYDYLEERRQAFERYGQHIVEVLG